MENFKVIVMAMFLFLSNAVLAQEGEVSSGLVKASLEDVLAEIKTDGRGKVSLSMSGNYYQKGSEGYGDVSINQNGEFFIQTITLNTDGDIVYGPQNKILNIFETKYQNAEYVFTGICPSLRILNH